MAFARRPAQGEEHAGGRPLRRVRLEAQAPGDPVGGGKADARDVLGELEGSPLDDAHRRGAVAPQHLGGEGGREALALEEDQRLPIAALAAPGLDDPAPPDGSDPRHLGQLLGLAVEHLEGAIAEPRDQPTGHLRADAGEDAGGEITLDAEQRLRHQGQERVDAELAAVSRVAHPGAGEPQPFAGRDPGQPADDGDRLGAGAALGPRAQHRPAGVRVLENGSLDGDLEGRRALGSLRHPGQTMPQWHAMRRRCQ